MNKKNFKHQKAGTPTLQRSPVHNEQLHINKYNSIERNDYKRLTQNEPSTTSHAFQPPSGGLLYRIFSPSCSEYDTSSAESLGLASISSKLLWRDSFSVEEDMLKQKKKWGKGGDDVLFKLKGLHRKDRVLLGVT